MGDSNLSVTANYNLGLSEGTLHSDVLESLSLGFAGGFPDGETNLCFFACLLAE